uniref:WD_REPEATS_REGION domain-containing protein n=1 Tax=Panagrellus redivivus TaxID=6233 RepID=A0A7E4VJ55_PANRE
MVDQTEEVSGPTMKVDSNNIRTFHPAKIFNDSTMPIIGMDFHMNGKVLVVSSLDDSLNLYNCETGTKNRSINSKKYGVGKVRFDRDDNAVLHTSTKVDNTVRYLSLTENKYVRYFLGHTKTVISLQVSALCNVFASASKDKTARIWDLRLNNCQGLVHFSNESVVGFDPEGLIFAAACAAEESVKLFDLRNFDKGPFADLEIKNPVPGSTWHDIKFSNDGTNIMVNSNSTYALCFESLETGPVQRLNVENPTNAQIGGTFTPCGKYAFVGNDGKTLPVFEIDKAQLAMGEAGVASSFETPAYAQLPTPNHQNAIMNIVFNPKYMHVAVASQTLEFWIPDIPESATPR